MGRASEFATKLRSWTLVTLGWVFTMLFVVVGAGAALSQMWFVTAASLLVAITVCPKIQIPRDVRPKAFTASLLCILLALVVDGSRADARQEVAQQAEVEQQEAERRASLQAEFESKRDTLMATVREALAGGDLLAAAQGVAPFRDVADEAFLETFRQLERRLDAERQAQRERDLVEVVRTVPAADRERNRDIYRELMTLDSTNARYRERFEHYNGLIMAERRAEQERIARFGQPPQRSAWDGSYRVVTTYLREIANDPGSIDVGDCTDVYYVDRGWLVGCDYRGANAFGALIRASNWFIVRHDQVIAMEDASAYNPR